MIKFGCGINGRLLLSPLVTLIAIAIVGGLCIQTIGQLTFDEHSARARVVAESALSVITFYESKADKGEMTVQAAQAAARDAVRAMRFDGDGYAFIFGKGGLSIAHPNPKIEGSNTLATADTASIARVRNQIAAAEAGGDYSRYLWPRSPSNPTLARKAAYSLLSKKWGWIISTTLYIEGVEQAEQATLRWLLPLVGSVAALSVAVALLVGRRIKMPIVRIANTTRLIAGGDLTCTVQDLNRKDEIGLMTQAVDVLRLRLGEAAVLAREQAAMKANAAREQREALGALAGEFESKVGQMIGVLSTGSAALESTSRSMAETAGTANTRASAVSDAARLGSSNVQSVATAAAQLAASFDGVSKQVEHSANMSNRALSQARQTDGTVRDLSESVERIGKVVEMISQIADKTNLLALNATIESARAGEAGKGFAVVANEVKSLAGQTTKATEDIALQIGHIQVATRQSVEAIQGITTTIVEVSTVATSIASAVQEQGVATAEIAQSAQRTAQATNDITNHVGVVSRAANDTGMASNVVLNAATSLSKQAEQISNELARFVAGVRAV